MAKLSNTEIDKALSALNEDLEDKWQCDDYQSIHKQFTFKNFVKAFGFMTQAAIIAEKLNHHPNWSNVYNKVDVTLMTHDVDGMSELDFALATKLESLG